MLNIMAFYDTFEILATLPIRNSTGLRFLTLDEHKAKVGIY